MSRRNDYSDSGVTGMQRTKNSPSRQRGQFQHLENSPSRQRGRFQHLENTYNKTPQYERVDVDRSDTVSGKLIDKMNSVADKRREKQAEKQQVVTCNKLEYDSCIASGRYRNIRTGEVVQC